MILEGIFNSKYSDARIDHIVFGDSTENEINVTWDSSEWWDEEDGSRHFLCEGVYFNDEYANGRLNEIEDMMPIGCQLYSPNNDIEFYGAEFESMLLDDDGETAWFLKG